MNKLLTRKGISFERLDTLRRVVQAGSVSVAAGGNASKQSLYSRQIRELEEALGFPLMDRSTTPHTVTAEAVSLSRMTGDFESSMTSLVKGEDNRVRSIVIGTNSLIARYLVIPEISGKLSRGEAGVSLYNLNTANAINALKEKKIDIAVTTGSAAVNDLESTAPFAYGWRIMGSPNLLPAGRKELDWRELPSLPLAVATGRAKVMLDAGRCLEAGQDGPFLAMECQESGDAVEAARSGNMLAVVPGAISRFAKTEGLVMRKVKQFGKDDMQLRVLWRAGDRERPELNRFIQVLSRRR